MINSSLSIHNLKKTGFVKLYEDFIINKEMSRDKYIRILMLATLFINSNDLILKKLGYRIIVIYCNRENDYKPLYDVTVNNGLVPVVQFIEKKYIKEVESNIFTEINSSFNKNFMKDNIYYSLQQKNMIDFYDEYKSESLSIVAPTSYGKTDLIITTIKESYNKNICVITPTKSLLAQTRMRIMRNSNIRNRKIITHPDMYNNEKNFIAIMTQERLYRLLRKESALKFDYVIIDEAHGLLNDDSRNTLLASVIIILEYRNSNTVFKFLTPFLCDTNNIKIKYTNYELKTYQIDEYIKTEKFYIADLKMEKNMIMYDQFVNKFFTIENIISCSNEWNFITKHEGKKNIIYFNKPKDIENFVDNIILTSDANLNLKIEKACKDIKEYVHPQYRLIDALKRGIIYHHGSVPEPIRLYIEKLYMEVKEIMYVVTSSTLLEGVNLPADRMFLLDNKKGTKNLTPSDFKNLIGRVCRFSQIFHLDSGDLNMLEPQVYFVVGEYYSKNANIKSFISNCMKINKNIHDNVENILLKNTNITGKNINKFNLAKELLENFEEGIIKEYDLRKAKTQVGKACFFNNITEMDIFRNEQELYRYVCDYKEMGDIISDTETLIYVLYEMFFSKINEDKIKRFEYIETRNFYKMFLDWRIENISLNKMINSFIRYWKGLIKSDVGEKLIYVGRWGDVKRNGHIPLWTDISKKTEVQMVNLAIVRIKEEQDFLDNQIIKYIEVLNDLEMIDKNLYLSIKYGTNNEKLITCSQNGLSLTLSKILLEKYTDYLFIDVKSNIIELKNGLIEAMKNANENGILICEAECFV